MPPLLLLAAAAATPAPAPEAIRPALRCEIVSLVMFGAGGAEAQSAGLMASLYWFGRIDGRASDADLIRWLEAERIAMTGADAQAEAKRCGDEMSRRGQALQAIGKSLSRDDATPEGH